MTTVHAERGENMARLIDADKLEKKLCEDCIGDRVCERRCYEVTLIRSMPAVDAVEVVRCKDCKHNSLNRIIGNAYCDLGIGLSQLYNYCSHGERRKDETD